MLRKEKMIPFESQLEHMKEIYGISLEDSKRVFSGYRKCLEMMISNEVDKMNPLFSFETPLGTLGFSLVDEIEKIDPKTLEKYIIPAHYTNEYSFVVQFLDISNKNVNLNTLPYKDELFKANFELEPIVCLEVGYEEDDEDDDF